MIVLQNFSFWSNMNIREVAIKQIEANGKFHHRVCRLCGEEIYFKKHNRFGPMLVCCTKCRPGGRPHELAKTWDEMHLILMSDWHEEQKAK